MGLIAVLVPLTAFADANDWWFLRVGRAPHPTSDPRIVKEGEWAGRRWQLIAYPSDTHGLCVSMTPQDSGATGSGGTLVCGPFVGVGPDSVSAAAPGTTIGFHASGGSEQLPPYIAGPVIEAASLVEVRFKEATLRVPTFPAPEPLAHIRFYAAPLPPDIVLAPEPTTSSLVSVAGLNGAGNVVACLTPQAASEGTSSLADCR